LWQVVAVVGVVGCVVCCLFGRLWLSSLVTWYCCHTGAPLQVGSESSRSEGLRHSTVDDVDVTGINGWKHCITDFCTGSQ
jgi:hypothetical protein